MLASTLLLASALAASSWRDQASVTIAEARARPDLVVEILSLEEPTGACGAFERVAALGPVSSSGPTTLRLDGASLDGRACSTFVRANVRVLSRATVVDKPMRAGDSLEGNVVTNLIEVKSPAFIPPAHARAARELAPGAVLRTGDVMLGPAPGTEISVVVRAGAVSLTDTGRIAACPPRTEGACAVLRGGQRLQGKIDERGALVVEVVR